ncbi:MAG TPA: hypothetical protein VH416_07405 [Gaiellaceae bacterium]|jgi:hypothetical protein
MRRLASKAVGPAVPLICVAALALPAGATAASVKPADAWAEKANAICHTWSVKVQRSGILKAKPRTEDQFFTVFRRQLHFVAGQLAGLEAIKIPPTPAERLALKLNRGAIVEARAALAAWTAKRSEAEVKLRLVRYSLYGNQSDQAFLKLGARSCGTNE